MKHGTLQHGDAYGAQLVFVSCEKQPYGGREQKEMPFKKNSCPLMIDGFCPVKVCMFLDVVGCGRLAAKGPHSCLLTFPLSGTGEEIGKNRNERACGLK